MCVMPWPTRFWATWRSNPSWESGWRKGYDKVACIWMASTTIGQHQCGSSGKEWWLVISTNPKLITTISVTWIWETGLHSVRSSETLHVDMLNSKPQHIQCVMNSPCQQKIISISYWDYYLIKYDGFFCLIKAISRTLKSVSFEAVHYTFMTIERGHLKLLIIFSRQLKQVNETFITLS